MRIQSNWPATGGMWTGLVQGEGGVGSNGEEVHRETDETREKWIEREREGGADARRCD